MWARLAQDPGAFALLVTVGIFYLAIVVVVTWDNWRDNK